MKLRRLTNAGIEAFSSYLDELETGVVRLLPTDMLSNSSFSEPMPADVEISKSVFGRRFEAAAYLDGIFRDSDLENIDSDIGLWAWLALLYFDELCPADRSGRRSPRERSRYVLEHDNFRRYYRHFLAGPYLIYKTYRNSPEIALSVLCQPLNRPGDLVEQLASRQELISNRALLATATRLYVDKDSMKAKRGASTKGAGSARRLAAVMRQFDVTWDVYGFNVEEFLELLPSEFQRFKS